MMHSSPLNFDLNTKH